MTTVAGLGQVPGFWPVIPARRLFTLRRVPPRHGDETVTAFRDGRVTKRSNRRTAGFTEALQEIGYQHVDAGDLVVHSMDGFAGAIGVSDSAGKMSPVANIYHVEGDARFFAYALRSLAHSGHIQSLAKGIRERSSSFDHVTVAGVDLPAPPKQEQRRIADFLDDRVARIGQIIAARRSQIEAITQLLNSESEAAFAEDEVVEAPALRLGASCAFFTDGDWIESPYITDGGVRLIQTGNVGVGTYREQGFRYISRETFIELKCTPVHEGDILISRLASPVGRACLCPDIGPAIASVDVTIARPQPWMDATFVLEFLSSPRHLSDTDELARGSTMQRVSRSQLSSVRVPSPHLATQRSVGAELAKARVVSATRQESLRASIEILAEYKQSLIMAAVTGELDVTTAGSGIPG